MRKSRPAGHELFHNTNKGSSLPMSNPKKRQADDAPPAKKSKKRKGNAQEDESLDTELGLNTLFSRMDNQLLADHLAKKLTRFGDELSPVELADITISCKLFQSSSECCLWCCRVGRRLISFV